MTETRIPPAPAVVEESGYLPSGGGSTYCTLFRPREPAAQPSTCVVLLGAFAEERKSSVRPLVEIARELAAAGLPCARVDFRGCGDSSGRSVDITVDGLIEDAVSSAKDVAAELSCDGVALCGLRLGGAIALLAAPRLKGVLRACVLIEPVVKGEAYVRELTRKQAIRRMMTKGSAKDDGEAASEVFDLDGIELTRSFVDDVAKIDLVESAGQGAVAGPAVLQVGPRASASPSTAALGEALSARVEVMRVEPFWLQTERVSIEPVAAKLREILMPGEEEGA